MWDVDLIGIVEEDNIYINRQNSIQVTIKVISNFPYSLNGAHTFSAYASDFEKYGFDDSVLNTEEKRINDAIEFFKDSLLIFKPLKKIKYDQTEHYNAKNVRLIHKNDSFNNETSYIAVPVFQETSATSFDDFVYKLVNNKYLGKIDNISTESEDTPPFILWKDQNCNYTIFGPFNRHSYHFGGFNFLIDNNLKQIVFKDEWLSDAYEDVENLLFVTQEKFETIVQLLQQENDSSYLIKNGILQGEMTEKSINESQVIPTTTSLQIASSPAISVDEVDNERQQPKSEQVFMEEFIAVAKEMGLAFDEKDLFNFHTSVKSAKLTILAGMSGTGKSKLVQAYSRALRLDPLIIPVRPSWSDDADLIGYVDSMNMVYRPGDSRLINTLIQAENDHKNLYIICFDEMNLARVEHYFSQFLSVLEMDPNDRKLRLYNPELSDRLYNHIQFPSEVKIGENVLFIGTVNLDESTYHFSDKVLDRANVIELEIIPFKQMRDMIEEQKEKIDRKFTNWSFQDYNGFRNRSKDNKEKVELTDIEVSFLWELHMDLKRTNKNLGIGPRIVRQIDTYLKNLPINPYLTRKQAFDLQIKQRILTKLRGPEDQLKDLLALQEGQLIGKLQDQFLKYKDVSEFKVTRNTLTQKAKELSSNGYTV